MNLMAGCKHDPAGTIVSSNSNEAKNFSSHAFLLQRRQMADTLNDILAGGQRSLVLFDEAGIKAVKALLTEKNGRPYIKCQIRQKEVQAKPEEIIRQLWIHRLLVH